MGIANEMTVGGCTFVLRLRATFVYTFATFAQRTCVSSLRLRNVRSLRSRNVRLLRSRVTFAQRSRNVHALRLRITFALRSRYVHIVRATFMLRSRVGLMEGSLNNLARKDLRLEYISIVVLFFKLTKFLFLKI